MVDFNFSQRLSLLRTQKGVSAREMSLEMGQNSNYINNIENHKAYPSLTGFYDICDYLDIEPKDFFDSTIKDPERLASIIQHLRQLTPEQLTYLEPLVKDLVK